MSHRIYQVDAFTRKPFTGNPAAVCLLSGPADERWMQDVAREMNLSETAFLYPLEDGFHLRWFTPRCEVELCGHATLASAHVLWETGRLADRAQARFHTLSGLLTALRQGDAIEMDFPSEPPTETDPPEGLLEALGLPSVRFTGKNRMDYLVEAENEVAVRSMSPDFSSLSRVACRGVIVTSSSESDPYDFISRFFAPQFGVDEDPVTGSAHCCLGPYWSEKLGKMDLRAYQASERGGEVGVQLVGKRVRLTGNAVTVMVGELL